MRVLEMFLPRKVMSDSMDSVAQHPGHVDGLKLALGLCICYTLCVACLRGYIRWRNYGVDDLVVLFSTVSGS